MANFVPTTEKRFAQWRGPTSSHDYNELIRTNYADLSRLYNLLKNLEERLANEFSQSIKENIILRNKLEQLEQKQDDLEAAVAEAEEEGTTTRYLYARFFTDTHLQDITVEGEEIPVNHRLSIDTIHGIATLPEMSSVNKLVTQDTSGATAIPTSLTYALVTSEPPEADTIAGNPNNALTPATNQMWERDLIVDGSEPSQDSSLLFYLRVPTDIVSQPNSNCLIIHLYPSFFVDFLDLAYSLEEAPSDNLIDINYMNGEGSIFEQHYPALDASGRWVAPNESGLYMNNARPLRLDFDPVAITAIRMKIRQRNYIKEGSVYVVPYGASLISLENRRYADHGSKVIRFDAPQGELIWRVSNIEGLIYNYPQSMHGDLAGARLFYENAEVYEEIDIGDTIPFGTETVYVEITLYESSGGGTPALTGVKISYEPYG